MEQIFGGIFEFLYQLCRPILPTTLLNFNLRYRGKVWVLLLATIILLFTRFAIIGRPFGSSQGTNKYNSNSQKYQEEHIFYETEFTSNGKFKKPKKRNNKKQSSYEQQKEQFEQQYGGKSNKKSSDNQYNDPYKNRNNKNNKKNDNYQDPYYEYNNYDNYGSGSYSNYNSRGSGYSSRSYDARGGGRGGGYNNYNNYNRGYNSGYYSSGGGGSWFSPYNLMIMFIMGSMILGMFRRGNGNDPNGNGGGGFNWNMLMPLMMFGGMPMGGMYGRFGRGFGRGFGRRRGFGRGRFF